MKKTNLMITTLIAGLISGAHAFAQDTMKAAPADTTGTAKAAPSAAAPAGKTDGKAAKSDDSSCGGPGGCGSTSKGTSAKKKSSDGSQ
jgi:hypothetical protein